MRKGIVVFAIFLLAAISLIPSVSAEEPPALTVQYTPQESGEAVVTFSLAALPQGGDVSYAQIDVSLQPGDFRLQRDSFSWLPKDEGVLLTSQWNGDGLLLLLEPKDASFDGLDVQPLFSLRLQNDTGGSMEPEFQVAYTLIDRAGRETLYTGSLRADIAAAVPTGSGPDAPVSADASVSEESMSMEADSSHPSEAADNAAPGWLWPLLIGLACCLIAAVTVVLLLWRRKRRTGDGGKENREET